ncbi:MAG: hypothetical protein QOF24_766 [Verrucomicrobiota bacterium]|jgi:predicted amidohydrolase YtcJ
MKSLSAVFFFVFFAASSALFAETAQTVFINANIYTMNERQPRAEAVAVQDTRIVFVGSNADAKKYQSKETRIIDLVGKTMVPGLTDSHCHIFGIGEREMNLNLEGTNTLEDFLAKVKERAAKAERGAWITGRGWIETFWQPPQFPTHADLDKVAPENPVFLTRADGHAAIANSAALQTAKIDKNTPNPFGGEILRDKQTGEATGMLLDHAQELVQKNLPKPTEAERREAFVIGTKREISLGWCEIQNAGSNLDDLPPMRQAFEAGQVKLRVYNALYGPGPAAEALLRDGPILNQYDHRFTQRTIKVVFDGALGSRGAALLEPYSDAPETSGYLTQKESELRPIFDAALRRGVQIETHAIGDSANRLILDLYEAAFKAAPYGTTPPLKAARDVRWRVEHAQILSASDLPRFAKLGVIASMQPSHAISDLFFAPSRLGKERLAGAYAWQSLIKSGAIVTGGSDAPVERGEPMIEFYAAVARKSIKGESADGWHSEQAVSREQALKMFTMSAAYAAFEEKDKGSIEVGKLADLTVLTKDIMKSPAPEILTTTCAMTVIGGEVVFEKQ